MDNLTYHQVNNINNNNNKTSSSTSTASSTSSTNPGNSNLNISPFPNVNTSNCLETSVSADFVTVGNEQIRLDQLPTNIRFELDQLELEFLEGDLTQKGYDKKKARLLAPYLTDLPIISSLASGSSSTITVSTPKMPNNVNRPTCQQQHVVNGAIPVRIQQNLRKTRRKNKDDPNVNRYHSDFIRYDGDNEDDYEIRQEAVKAALASYPADQNQAIVPSSKRNTAYLLPLNNAPPVLAKEEEEENTSDQKNDLDNNKASVPFPVPIIDTDPNNKPITKNSTKVIEDITGDVFSDESTDDELLESNQNQQQTPKNQTSYENRPILLFQTPNSPTSPPPNVTSSPPTIIPNMHSNQYYDYCPQNTKNLHNNEPSTTTIPTETTANKTTDSPNSLLSTPDKSIQSIKSPVVAIIQHSANVKQTSHLNNSKILVPKKAKTQASRARSDDHSSSNTNNSSLTNTSDRQRPLSPGGSITQHISSVGLNQSGSSGSEIQDIRQPTRVSAKIQQLLNTLKRPKRKPLNEYFEDNQEEVAIPPLDPAMPKPEGGTSVPACGEPLLVPASFPQSIEAAIHKFANSSSKATCMSVLDQSGKSTSSLTYNKLLKRAQQSAYHLLNKLTFQSPSTGTDLHLKLGDRVALVFPNNDPIGFTISFCACLMAGLVALPIDVPLARRDAGSQNLGFLLGQVGASCVLTSEICFKALPKNPNTEMVEFKGWPKIPWLVVEHLTKSPPKDWSPPNRIPPDNPAYIEYSSLKDGSVTGVTVTRNQMLCHCQTLNVSCQYAEGEYVVCVLDFKREFGLWHGVQSTIFNGMHMVYVPYSVMKVNPAIWLTTIARYKASVALVKSRDMHWGMMAQRDHKDINLGSLRMLLVADGANPWSLSSCDTFLDVFQSKGLKAETICPSAGSSETLTLSIRRPNRSGPQSSGRGVLSMSGLSYGVVRVDQENSLTSLTLQDVGQVLPGTLVAVVRLPTNQTTHQLPQQATASSSSSSTSPTLCQTDEIGEICISSRSTANSYFGLQGLTTSQFKLIPHGSDNLPIGKHEFVRSGLLGFLGPSGLVFVCGCREGLIEVSGRRHNTDDIIATVLAVEPMKFIFRGRIAVFSTKVLRDERVIIIAEQRPDATEEECFQWMSRVLQAVDSIHHVGVYCLSLVPPNTLPKTPLGGIHVPETRSKFLEGTLHPTNVLMCPHTCVLNLPKPREHHPEREVGPSAVLAGSIVQGRRLAEAKGRELCDTDESDTVKKFQYLGDILRWRASTNPDHVLFTVINAKGQEVQKLTCGQLHKKAERVACLLMEKGQLTSGDHVALIFSPSIDLVAAFYACLYVGVVPVPIRPPHVQNIQTTLPTIKMIVEMSRIKGILTSSSFIKLFKSKEASAVIDSRQWPVLMDIDENIKKKLSNFYRPPCGDQLAYLDFSVSTTGMLAGVQMSHSCSTNLCRAIKLSCELYPSREVVLCLDPYSGLGFVLWCLNSVYSGHHSILVPPVEVEINPCIWLATVSHFKVRDTFCSYSVMELCTKGLRSSVIDLKQRGINLSCVRTCAIIAEERPRIQLTNSFTKLFQSLGLPARSVSTTFGCRANIAVCLQGASDPDPTPVYVDQRALRNDRVTIVEKGSPHSICLLESGKLLPGVKVVIANPETKGQCADSHLGEIWVQSPHNSNGYFNIYGEDVQNDHFNCHLATGDTISSYARTGYLGFVRRTEDVKLSNSDPHDAIYIVGSLDETLMIKGMRYHPIDLEATILRCHKKICECACFTWTNLLVVVVELDGSENEALDLIPLVTNSVLEDHYLIVGVVVVVDPGVVPINSRGEKQRMHLRDGFLSDLLDPIYVAYNM